MNDHTVARKRLVLLLGPPMINMILSTRLAELVNFIADVTFKVHRPVVDFHTKVLHRTLLRR